MTEVPGGRVLAGVYAHSQALQLPQVVVHVDLKLVPGTPRKVAPLQWELYLQTALYLNFLLLAWENLEAAGRQATWAL